MTLEEAAEIAQTAARQQEAIQVLAQAVLNMDRMRADLSGLEARTEAARQEHEDLKNQISRAKAAARAAQEKHGEAMDQAMREAERNVARIKADADTKAEKVLAGAQSQAERLIAHAQTEAQAAIARKHQAEAQADEHDARKEGLSAEITILSARLVSIRAAIKQAAEA